MGEVALPRRAHQRANQCQTVSPESIHSNNSPWTQYIVFRNIYVNTDRYMHAIAIEKRGHKFEGRQEGVNERICGRYSAIKIQSQI